MLPCLLTFLVSLDLSVFKVTDFPSLIASERSERKKVAKARLQPANTPPPPQNMIKLWPMRWRISLLWLLVKSLASRLHAFKRSWARHWNTNGPGCFHECVWQRKALQTNFTNPYLIHSRTQKAYQMFKVFQSGDSFSDWWTSAHLLLCEIV